MRFEIGDAIELDFGKEYIVINECVLEQKEYYLVFDKQNIKETIIIQANKDSDEIKIVKEREKIQEVLKIMSNKDK